MKMTAAAAVLSLGLGSLAQAGTVRDAFFGIDGQIVEAEQAVTFAGTFEGGITTDTPDIVQDYTLMITASFGDAVLFDGAVSGHDVFGGPISVSGLIGEGADLIGGLIAQLVSLDIVSDLDFTGTSVRGAFDVTLGYFDVRFLLHEICMITNDTRPGTGSRSQTVTACNPFGTFSIDVALTREASEVSEVPLPAGLPLLVAGIGALGLARRRARA